MAGGIRTALAAACAVLLACSLTRGQRLELKPLPAVAWEPVSQTQPLTVVAAAATSAPTIDGRLDDAIWQQTPAIDAFNHVGGLDAAQTARWVALRVAVREQSLHLAARLANPGAPLRAVVKETGGRVWTDDCLELYFHDAAGARTHQVIVNANGAWWAGVKSGTGSWKPALLAAASRDETGWSVELSIPLADLPMTRGGEAAVPFQARYLVRNQAAYVAWAPGVEPGQLGLLCFNNEQLPQQRARVTEVLMPAELPANGGDLGVRLHNPTDRARTAVVRLTELGNANPLATQRATIDPGQTREVTIRLTPPASPRAFVLLAQDEADKAWTFRDDGRIGVRPDFRLTLTRERFWFGERRIDAELELGVPADELAQTTLAVSLFSRTHELERTAPVTMSAGRYALSINLQDLPPGAYKLALDRQGPRGSRTDLHDLELQQAMPLPARQRVDLKLDWPQGAGDAAPVYCGLALPGGVLMDPAKIRVVDDRGQETPAQVDPLATWSPAGSLRWVGLRFNAQRQRRYVAEFGSDVTRAQAGDALRVTQSEQGIVVDTGSARWELPRTGPLLGKAWIGKTQVLAGDRAVLLLRDHTGQTADETRNDATEQPVVELAGPQHVVIRREGLYRTASGQRLGKYVVRVAFDAGSAVAQLQHSFIITEDSAKVQYADVAVRVAPAFAGPWRATVPHGSQRHAADIDPARGGVYLAQLVYPHFKKSDSRYDIAQRGDAGWSTVAQGEVAGNWLAAQRRDAGAGVAVAIRDFARTFPKELELAEGALTAHLWSSRGGRLLDHRAASLVEHWGLEWSATYPGGLDKLKAIQATAAGTARTHDLAITLLGPEPDANLAAAQREAQRLDEPVLAIQDPQWLRTTNALGPLHPYDPQRFPRIEAFSRNVFKQLLVDQATNCGDFGYLDRGNGPHAMTVGTTATPGKGHQPRLGYRYTNMDYHGRTGMWLAYARSGDRIYFDYAEPFTRHLYDYRFSYWTGPKRKLGAILGGSVSEDVPMYWAGWTGHDDVGLYAGHQGIDLSNFHMQYFLTGDRRAMDGPTLFTQRLIEDFDPMQLPNVGATSSACMALALPAQAYFQTWDERIARKLHIARQRALDLRTTTGLAQQDYYGALYKWHVRHWGTLEDYKVTGAALSRQSLLVGLPLLLSHVPEPTLGYQDHGGAFANFADQWTDDPRWASWLAARLESTVAAYSDEQGNIVGEPYAGTHNANFMQVVAFGLDLLARQQPRLTPYPQLEVLNLADTAPVWLRKQPRQDVTLHVSYQPGWDLQVRHFDPKFSDWRGSYYAGPLHVTGRQEIFSRNAPGLAEGSAMLRLPPDVIDGDYQITGANSVLSGDASGLVVLAREGVYLKGLSLQPEAWHLQLPAKARGRIYVSRDTDLTLGEARQTLKGKQWHELANGGADPLPATLWVRGMTYVRFDGDIPAVLAAHDASRWFLPQGAQTSPLPLPQPVDAALEFVPGRSGKPGDQAVLVTRSELSIPVGQRLDPRRWQNLDWTRGTIEFWYQPRWSSDLQSAPVVKTLLGGTALPFSIEYNHQIPNSLSRRSVFFSLGNLTLNSQGAGEGSWYSLRLVNPTQMHQGRWTHIAVCWDTEPDGRGWIAELYRDGLGSGLESGGRNAAGPFHVHESEPSFKRFLPRQRGDDGKEAVLWLMSALDGAVDDLRISNVVRYPRPFDVGQVQCGVADEHTLMLLPFDGKLDAQVPAGNPAIAARRGR